MGHASRFRPLLRWVGLALCTLILVGFLFSTRRAVTWHSPGLRHEASLLLGTIAYGWRPEGWRLEDERYPPTSGWGMARYGGKPRLIWWIRASANRSWQSISVPLWMPFLLFAVPTAAAWYRDRRAVADRIRQFSRRLRPKRRKRVTLRLYLAFIGVHLVAVLLGTAVLIQVYGFFFPPASGDRGLVDRAVTGGPAVLFSGTPLWAVLWAWLYVKLLNRLRETMPASFCDECGYNLTGNTTGVCPECGTLSDSMAGRKEEEEGISRGSPRGGKVPG